MISSAISSKPYSSTQRTESQRLLSVDALRGFDMFWIIGANSLVYALNRMTDIGPMSFVAKQLEHAEWEGFRFYDLIFPLFIFVVGVSLVFSLQRALAEDGLRVALRRIARRSLLLFAIGIFYSGGISKEWPDVRLMGVLNRIALVYLLAATLYCFCKPRWLAVIAAGLLLGYWGLMTYVPIRDITLTKPALANAAQAANEPAGAAAILATNNPSATSGDLGWATAERLFRSTTNYVTGSFENGRNLANHIDFMYLPGRKYDTFYDPEGLLSTLPAVATCLLGIFAGLLLQNSSVRPGKKVLVLMLGGLLALILGWVWSLQFPVVKKIWTSSFVLVSGGYSAILLGAFYLIIEVWNRRSWCQPFVWIGANSITIYLVSSILSGFRPLAERIVGGDLKVFLNGSVTAGLGDLAISLVGLLLAFCFVHFLYQRKIFLRL